MSDKAIDNAMTKRDALASSINQAQQQIDGWRKELAKVDEFIAAWHVFAGDQVEIKADASGASEATANFSLVTTETKPKRIRHNSPKEQVAETAREVILSYGRPLMRSELFPELRARGLVIDGADPEMVLSTMLWRMKERIVRVKGGGYWLTEMPYEPVGYDPNNPKELETLLSMPAGEHRKLSDQDKEILREDGIEIDDGGPIAELL